MRESNVLFGCCGGVTELSSFCQVFQQRKAPEKAAISVRKSEGQSCSRLSCAMASSSFNSPKQTRMSRRWIKA